MNLAPWGLLDRIMPGQRAAQRATDPYMPAIGFNDWLGLFAEFTFNGHQYTVPGSKQEEPSGQYTSLVQTAYKSCGPIFACTLVRQLLFSEARFQFRTLQSGRPGKLFGTPDLAPLETPWPGATTGDLLSRIIQSADIAGNAYAVRRGSQIRVLRPDWVTLVIGGGDNAAWDVDAQVIGYIYTPGGKNSGRPPSVFSADEVAHFAPIPDPDAQFRGMSWITPVIREVMGDKAATEHKLTFFENGATINQAVKFDIDSVEKMRPWIELFKEQHSGAANAYKTLFLGAGTDLTAVGSTFEQIQFKVTQGAGETRIAAAAGVPPVIVGLSEGLQAATYSNYGQARRRFADGTMRPLWRNVAGSLARIVTVPNGAELWYDDRDIPFLAEDEKDRADIAQVQAVAINTLVTAGFTPDSARDAVSTGDFGLLTHSGMVSVQLQKPGTPNTPPAAPAPAGNGANADRARDLVQRFIDEATAGR